MCFDLTLHLFVNFKGGQSDQGYGSKDELHQVSVDASKATAFPLSTGDHASNGKTVLSQENGTILTDG